jgi:hypothetical protein
MAGTAADLMSSLSFLGTAGLVTVTGSVGRLNVIFVVTDAKEAIIILADDTNTVGLLATDMTGFADAGILGFSADTNVGGIFFLLILVVVCPALQTYFGILAALVFGAQRKQNGIRAANWIPPAKEVEGNPFLKTFFADDMLAIFCMERSRDDLCPENPVGLENGHGMEKVKGFVLRGAVAKTP